MPPKKNDAFFASDVKKDQDPGAAAPAAGAGEPSAAANAPTGADDQASDKPVPNVDPAPAAAAAPVIDPAASTPSPAQEPSPAAAPITEDKPLVLQTPHPDITGCRVDDVEYVAKDGRMEVAEKHVAHLLGLGFTFVGE